MLTAINKLRRRITLVFAAAFIITWLLPAMVPAADQPAPPAKPVNGSGAGEIEAEPGSMPPAQSPASRRAHLVFRIQPGDAAVYLNDRFVGTGEELSTLSRGLQVPAGQHTVTVSRPGLVTREQTVVVGPGKSEVVEISLQGP